MMVGYVLDLQGVTSVFTGAAVGQAQATSLLRELLTFVTFGKTLIDPSLLCGV